MRNEYWFVQWLDGQFCQSEWRECYISGVIAVLILIAMAIRLVMVVVMVAMEMVLFKKINGISRGKLGMPQKNEEK